MTPSTETGSKQLKLASIPVLALSASLLALGVSVATGLSLHPEWFGEAVVSKAQTGNFQVVDNAVTQPLPIGNGSENMIADVAQNVAPSVVNIDVKSVAKNVGIIGPNPFEDDMFNYFFGFPSMPHGGPRGMQGMPVLKGNGSGVILNEDGVVLTNNHVIKGADEIVVTLNDGRKFDATVVGRDPMTDLALVKMKNASKLTPAKFGDSSHLRPGEWVIAVGSPLGFDHTVTIGIVSALSRQIPDINSNVEFIQTDAAINPGNSGGPLVNLRGEVIGINTAIAGSGQNIGFAIPVNTVKNISKDLLAGGKVTRPWIGVSMAELTPQLSKSLGVSETAKGVVVAQVYPDSPALRSGLSQGDIIQRIDGKAISSPKEIQDYIRSKPINSELNLQILREGKMQALSLKTETLPNSANQ